MKRRRLCVAACLVICLIGYNISGTFGMEQTSSTTDDVIVNPVNTGELDGSGSGVSGDESLVTTPGGGVSGDDNVVTPPGDGSVDDGAVTTPPGDGSGDGGTVTTPPGDGSGDGGAVTTPPGDGPGEDGTVTTPPAENGSETITPELPAETPDAEEPAEEAPAEEAPVEEEPVEEAPVEEEPAEEAPVVEEPAEEAPVVEEPTEEVPVVEEPAEEIPVVESDGTIFDTNPEAVHIGSYYNKSGVFLDTREKTKYNVSIPIEGLPSFITQDMIIGALKCQDLTGFPASVTIAQIIQESGFGIYGPNGENGQGLSYLAYQYNNLFGIKGSGPAGSVSMRTGEQTADGESYMTTAGFAVYNTYTECIEDRTRLLQEVYSDLTVNVSDANTFAMNIGGRWATDIQYAQSLIHQMETYDLYRLDRMTLLQFNAMIGRFADPCPGAALTSSFGYREFRNSYHQGIDLGTGTNNIPTYAADAGTVVTAGWSDSAGNWIVIDHGNGLVTKYMHHDVIYVTEGQHVEKGQQLGLSGTTGDSTGNHLHFQVEENGVSVDPAPYLGLTQ